MNYLGRASRKIVFLSAIVLTAVVIIGLVPWRLVAAEPKPAGQPTMSANAWAVPQTLIGTWAGQSHICVPPKNGSPGRVYKDAVAIRIVIASDGGVEGQVGSARLVGCKVKANRGGFGKALNLWTDYIIGDGRLEGPVYTDDPPNAKRSFTIPFNSDGGTLKGGCMLLKDGEYPFPLLPEMQLTKQPSSSVAADLAPAIAEITRAGGEALPVKDAEGRPALFVLFQPDSSSDEKLALISDLSRVKSLELQGAAITDAGFKRLPPLDRLEGLGIGRTSVTDAGLARVAALGQLRVLGLGDSKVTDAGLEHVKGLNRLETLYLSNTAVTDKGLRCLAGLSNLQTLVLRDTQVSDVGLQSLRGLRQLRQLSLRNTKVTDAGMENLTGLSHLAHLILEGTRITAEGAKKLQQALPNCKIEASVGASQLKVPEETE